MNVGVAGPPESSSPVYCSLCGASLLSVLVPVVLPGLLTLCRPSRAFFLTRSADLAAREVGDTVGGGVSVWTGLAGVRVLERPRSATDQLAV